MKKVSDKLYCKDKKKIRDFVKEFISDEEGLGVVELVLIIIILIALVILFKDKVTDFIKELFKDATENKNRL